ncbi:unnamed protein product, partial [Phaeothamnion confervicola]
MSSIVAILLSGMTCRHYAHCNLSDDETREIADFIFRILSFFADNSVFLFLGMGVFGVSTCMQSFNVAFIFNALFSSLVSRGVVAVLVFGLSYCINATSGWTGMQRIPPNTQLTMWFAGLRGSVAFVAASSFPDAIGHCDLMQTTTMSLILLFTFVMAPWTVPLLRLLKIDMHV